MSTVVLILIIAGIAGVIWLGKNASTSTDSSSKRSFDAASRLQKSAGAGVTPSSLAQYHQTGEVPGHTDLEALYQAITQYTPPAEAAHKALQGPFPNNPWVLVWGTRLMNKQFAPAEPAVDAHKLRLIAIEMLEALAGGLNVAEQDRKWVARSVSNAAITLVNGGSGFTTSLPDRFTTLAVAGGLVHIGSQLDPQSWRTSYATITEQWSDELNAIGLDSQHRFAGQAYAFVGVVERWRDE